MAEGRGQLVGRWNDCVGIAFFTFFVQYGCRAFAMYVEPALYPDHPGAAAPIGWITIAVVYVCSFLNNLLFLAGARILLNKNSKSAHEVRPPSAKEGLRARLKYRWVMLVSALPGWSRPAWLLLGLLVCLVPLLEGTHYPYMAYYPYFIWVRIHDALFSVFCLCWLAYAIWLSFSVRRFMALACVGFVVVLAYGAGQVVYAANPFIAYSISDTHVREHFRPVKWFWDRLEPEMGRGGLASPAGGDESETGVRCAV